MPYLIGGSAAAAVLFLNLIVVRNFTVAYFALHWWLVRLAIEAAQGLLAVAAAKAATVDPTGTRATLTWIGVGAVAPYAIRQLRYGDSEGDRFSFDLESVFDRLRSPLEDRIETASAEVQSASDAKLVRRLAKRGVSAAGLAGELLAVIRVRPSLQSNATDVIYISETVESAEEDEDKLRLLVELSRSLHVRRTARRLARRG